MLGLSLRLFGLIAAHEGFYYVAHCAFGELDCAVVMPYESSLVDGRMMELVVYGLWCPWCYGT